MIGAIRSEWIKFRSVRANIILIAIALTLPVILSILISSLASFRGMESARDDFGAAVVVPSMLAVYLCGVLGVLGIGQEYRHNTIRVTFAAQPRRSTVLGAKSIVYGAFGLFVGIVTPMLCLVASAVIIRGRHIPYDASGAALIGLVVLSVLMMLFGFGLGSILRQPAGAIPVFLIWPLIVESILAGIFSSVNRKVIRWLPFQSAQQLVNFNTGPRGEEHFSRAVSGVYFGLWVALIVGFGWWLVERRDA